MNTMIFSSAADRNQQPILDQLQTLFPQQGTVLEIGSGTGQHAVFFSREMPGLLWQPSEEDRVPYLSSIPGIGNLFKRRANQTKKRELLMFVTPTIVEDRPVVN